MKGASRVVACALVAVLVGVLVLGGTTGVEAQSGVAFSFDLTQPTTPFPHFWQRCVGSGHALLALRADWREMMTRTRRELGFEFVRFHGLLDDDMSTYTVINGQLQFSFFNVDSIFDFLLSIDMKPLVELSFMPVGIASGNTTVFHYQGNTTPPSSWSQWGMVIQGLVQHLVERYGYEEVRQWPFEVWNEPNCGFWTGTQADYFTLYQTTAKAIKAVDPLIPVGGPATCQSAWIPEFLQFCSQNNVPVDFISTHEYPTDIQPVTRNVMQNVTSIARQQAGSLPLYYTEYNDGLYDPPFHDSSYAAAFIVKNVNDVQGNVDLWSWWTFSDIFEEQGFSWIPFNDPNGWGLLNRYNIANPSYRAFQLLRGLGTEKVAWTRSTTPANSTANNLEAYATVKNTTTGTQQLDIMVYNVNVPYGAVAHELAKITVVGVPAATTAANITLHSLTPTHPNPAGAWQQMGSPPYPTKSQLQLLDAESVTRVGTINYVRINSTAIQFQVELPPQSVYLLSLGF